MSLYNQHQDNNTQQQALDLLVSTELRLLLAGKVIDAVKSIRERLGLGLKESKQLVDLARDMKLRVNANAFFVTCDKCDGRGQVAENAPVIVAGIKVPANQLGIY